MSKAKQRRAQQMLARWPEHWPQKADYLARHLPGRPPADGLPLGVRLRDAFRRMYWWPKRLTWRKDGGYLVSVSPRDMLGSGAIRLGTLPPERPWDRLAPLQVWVPRTHIFRHIALAGITGAGKTTTLGIAIPFYACYAGQSVFVVDPKGNEYHAWLCDHFRRHGAQTAFFNPWEPGETLLAEPVWSASREQIDIIVAMLVKTAGERRPNSDANNGFFEKAALHLLTGCMVALQYLPRRYCSLPTLYRIIAMGGKAITELFAGIAASYPPLEAVEESCRRLVAVPADRGARPLERGVGSFERPATLTAALTVIDRCGYEIQSWLRDARHAAWATKELPTDAAHPAWGPSFVHLRELYARRRKQWDENLQQLGTVFEQPDSTFGNILQFARNYLTPFQSAEMQRAFARAEFDVRDAARRQTLCVIGMPLDKAEVGSKFVGSLFANLMLNTVYTRSRYPEDHPMRQTDLILLIDEMPQAQLPDLGRILATIRSFRAAVFGIYQSDYQLKENWGEGFGTVLDNFATQINLYGSKGETAKRFAEMIGKAELLQENRSMSKGNDQRGRNESVSESVQVVDRIRPEDLTYMKVNGKSRGEQAAVAVGAVGQPFLFDMIPWWDDAFLRQEIRATPPAGRGGRWKLPENRRPFTRAPRFEVLNPDKRPDEAWVFATDAAGRPIEDPHVTDPLRDTVDFIAPPERTTYYEITDPVFVPEEIGLTPVTAQTLQETLARKMGQAPPGPGPASGAGAPAPPGAAPIESRVDWVEAAIAHDDGLPKDSALPLLIFEERRYGWRELWTRWTDARRAKTFARPAVLGVPPQPGAVDLDWYLVQGLQAALDYPTWLVTWLTEPNITPGPIAEVREALASALLVNDCVTGGIPAPDLFFRAWVASERAIPPVVCQDTANYLEQTRDRCARALDGEDLATLWVDLRVGLLDFLPELVAPAIADRFLASELLIDAAAYARATHLDLTTLVDPNAYDDDAFAEAMAKAQWAMPARNALTREMREGTRLAAAAAASPTRVGRAKRLAEAIKSHNLAAVMCQRLNIVAPAAA